MTIPVNFLHNMIPLLQKDYYIGFVFELFNNNSQFSRKYKCKIYWFAKKTECKNCRTFAVYRLIEKLVNNGISPYLFFFLLLLRNEKKLKTKSYESILSGI